jgi:diaminohydroxyphosphoribosylaminopyrimidine deaminase/5-amino-6-(5-phosphoribosylamino)uracil reductase
VAPEPDPANEDEQWMAEAIALGQDVRASTSPNPWVGAVVVPPGDAPVALGATQPPGGPHAEVVALQLAGASARGSTLYVTLEPCSHHGRTPPCVDAVLAAGVRRVVVGIEDPDPRVGGRGIQRLRNAGIDVSVGVCTPQIEESLAPYLTHRRTGRPWVVLKLALTLDGRIAAPDGTSKWITGPAARADAHRLRAESDAVVVGAGTVRTDDPALTVRDAGGRDPLRIVLGDADPRARVMPALFYRGELGPLLDDLGARDVVQLLVEGGSAVAGDFHRAGLVDQYVLYYAPAILGGDDGLSAFGGKGAATMEAIWRGRITRVLQIGSDLRVDVLAGGDSRAVP